MKKFFTVIYNIIRGITKVIAWAFIISTTWLIWLITLEPGTKGHLTKRKARRIRALTKVKLFYFNNVPDSVHKFLGIKLYKEYLNEHLGNGVQLCFEQTDRRAV